MNMKPNILIRTCWKISISLALFSHILILNKDVFAMPPKKERDLPGDREQDSRKPYSMQKLSKKEQPILLFNALMQKAAIHFHSGEKDQQLNCYKQILIIEGLSPLFRARTHANIAVVHLHLGQTIIASLNLQKAEGLASLEELETVMGPQSFSVFATTYHKTAEDLYLNHPQKALEYELKALKVPKQEESWYEKIHLHLAILHDRLLKFKESLDHALKAKSGTHLTSDERDRALAFAAMGSAEIGKHEDCLKYFDKIRNIDSLPNTERFLLLSTVGGYYLSNQEWEKGINFRIQATNVLDTSTPQYLWSKYHLAMVYGESGNKEKEVELYSDVLELIRSIPSSEEWRDDIVSIHLSIEIFFFVKEQKEKEEREAQVREQALQQ
ncbi:MAG: hypothetical protein HON43_04305 [Alphaproteobacteria bacterium]|jgi:tetratricopeptide (TPR) repeat protein|nr:hypothetical protein [Alphaproteobacteria bacterium]MBT5390317.1 hypothetical protein [Alphaproteobacteria bacterium]